MEIDTFQINKNGTVVGSGSDTVGDFEINGTFKNHDIKWVKQYIGAHKIFYSGSINEEHT